MNFRHKVIDLINNFHREYGFPPNELFLGTKEEYEMNCYINDNPFLKVRERDIEETLIRCKQKNEFCGLKIRYEDLDSCFEVRYNPYYD